jgi:carbon monoxide dehydrogenase subunit G
MKVPLNRVVPLAVPAERAWTLLQDVPGVAACMPGAKITEQVDAARYKGVVAVKVGPASLSFRGEIEVQDVDAASRSLRLLAKGTDTTGGSGASMGLAARIEARDAASCTLIGDGEVSMSGKAAGFGARMMSTVADQVIGQFAANFAARLQAAPEATPSAPTMGTIAPSAGKPLSVLGLFWGALKSWLRLLIARP